MLNVLKVKMDARRTPLSQQRRHIMVQGEKLCQVCGDKSLAHHFGALTCETCKAFFRRNGLRQNAIKPCSEGESCIIDKTTRRSCPSCRLKKCFDIGMKAEFIFDEQQRQALQNKIKQKKQLHRSNTMRRTQQSRNKSGELSPGGHQIQAQFGKSVSHNEGQENSQENLKHPTTWASGVNLCELLSAASKGYAKSEKNFIFPSSSEMSPPEINGIGSTQNETDGVKLTEKADVQGSSSVSSSFSSGKGTEVTETQQSTASELIFQDVAINTYTVSRSKTMSSSKSYPMQPSTSSVISLVQQTLLTKNISNSHSASVDQTIEEETTKEGFSNTLNSKQSFSERSVDKKYLSMSTSPQKTTSLEEMKGRRVKCRDLIFTESQLQPLNNLTREHLASESILPAEIPRTIPSDAMHSVNPECAQQASPHSVNPNISDAKIELADRSSRDWDQLFLSFNSGLQPSSRVQTQHHVADRRKLQTSDMNIAEQSMPPSQGLTGNQSPTKTHSGLKSNYPTVEPAPLLTSESSVGQGGGSALEVSVDRASFSVASLCVEQSRLFAKRSSAMVEQRRPPTVNLAALAHDQLPSDPHMYWRMVHEERALLNHLTSSYNDTILWSLKERKSSTKLDLSNFSLNKYLSDCDFQARQAVDFVKRIADFQNLTLDDQIACFKYTVSRALCIRTAFILVQERRP